MLGWLIPLLCLTALFAFLVTTLYIALATIRSPMVQHPPHTARRARRFALALHPWWFNGRAGRRAMADAPQRAPYDSLMRPRSS